MNKRGVLLLLLVVLLASFVSANGLEVIDVESCSGEGEFYAYKDNAFQNIDVNFTTQRDQLLVFTRADYITAPIVRLSGIPASLNTVFSPSSPFRVKIYSVDTNPGDNISVTGTSSKKSRSIQGYLAQDKSSPVFDEDTFQIVFDGISYYDVYLTEGDYSYLILDKYSLFSEGGPDDSRRLNVSLENSAEVSIFSQLYTKPSPSPIEGAVVGGFTVPNNGDYQFIVDTEDSVYWSLINCSEEPYCGDGSLDSGEECDDGNNEDGDGCSSDCELELFNNTWIAEWYDCEDERQRENVSGNIDNSDPDGDCLTNYWERLWDLDPNDPDTDGDGLNDGQCIYQFVDPCPKHCNDYDFCDPKNSSYWAGWFCRDINVTPEPPSNVTPVDDCEGADLVFDVDLSTVGENCYSGTAYSVVDSTSVSVSEAGNYRVVARSIRGISKQSNEKFYLIIDDIDSGVSEDDADPLAYTVRYEDFGTYHFDSGSNEVIMHHASICPPDSSPGSVDVNQICLYKECEDDDDNCDEDNGDDNGDDDDEDEIELDYTFIDDMMMFDLHTCNGDAEFYAYYNKSHQEINTSFTVYRDQLLIFTRSDYIHDYNLDVNVNGVPASKSVVYSTTSPFHVKIYSVDVSSGDVISVNGTSHAGKLSRSVQGYLAQDTSSPVFDVDSFDIIFNDVEIDESYFTADNYTYLVLDKYTKDPPGHVPDNRYLKVKVRSSGGSTIYSETYNQPSPSPVQGAVVGAFQVVNDGFYYFEIDTQDSVYWPLINCSREPVCGDGIMDEGEECDDGNNEGGDGCSAECELEEDEMLDDYLFKIAHLSYVFNAEDATAASMIFGLFSEWLYNDTNVDLPDSWTSLIYDDSNWGLGFAYLGYNEFLISTVLDFGGDPDNKYPAYYFRKHFTIPNLEDIDNLEFNIDYDDGFVAYINGHEFLRSPGASTNHSDFVPYHESSIGDYHGGTSGKWLSYNLTASDMSYLNGGGGFNQTCIPDNDYDIDELEPDYDFTEDDGMMVFDLHTCNGDGEFYAYYGQSHQEINTSFTVSRDQLLIFTRGDYIHAHNLQVNVNGVPASKSVVFSETSPFYVKIYSVDTSAGDVVSINGTSHAGKLSRSVQGYLAQDSADPIFDIDSFKVLFDDIRTEEVYLVEDSYSYLILDKYTKDPPGHTPVDSRYVDFKISHDGDVVFNEYYTQPSPTPVQGALVAGFDVSRPGIYELRIDAEDSVYSPLINCSREPDCGDGVLDDGEECDDGNNIDGDCCSSDCEIEDPHYVPGDDNVIAIEVHQYQPDSSDIVLGAYLVNYKDVPASGLLSDYDDVCYILSDYSTSEADIKRELLTLWFNVVSAKICYTQPITCDDIPFNSIDELINYAEYVLINNITSEYSAIATYLSQINSGECVDCADYSGPGGDDDDEDDCNGDCDGGYDGGGGSGGDDGDEDGDAAAGVSADGGGGSGAGADGSGIDGEGEDIDGDGRDDGLGERVVLPFLEEPLGVPGRLHLPFIIIALLLLLGLIPPFLLWNRNIVLMLDDTNEFLSLVGSNVLKSTLKANKLNWKYKVQSGGSKILESKLIPSKVVEFAKNHNLDLGRNRTKKVTKGMLKEAKKIVVMESKHQSFVSKNLDLSKEEIKKKVKVLNIKEFKTHTGSTHNRGFSSLNKKLGSKDFLNWLKKGIEKD